MIGNEAGILSCQVSKNIRNTEPGTFNLMLAPGGPGGPNYGPSWTEIVTPMSLVIISMQRYDAFETVMIGIVTSPVEVQRWRSARGVQRVITISGQDFQYFFSAMNYYTLSMLGATRGAIFGDIGLPAIMGSALLGNQPPNVVGAAWYNTIMAAPGAGDGTGGILGQTFFNYQGSKILFYDLMSTWFEAYDAAIEIPIGDYFMVSQGSWITKFLAIFPFPWYEFFIQTVPVGFYGTNGTPANSPLTTTGFPPSSPQLVARVNPLPWTNNYSPSSGFTMDTSRWEGLESYTLNTSGFIESDVQFNINEVRNFYVINPKWLTQLFGVSNASSAPFIFMFSAWLDTASINRYGYRPQITETHWFSDIKGQGAVVNSQNPINFQQLVAQLGLRITSYFEPTPLMASGTVQMELRPDIFAGNRFTYKPFKNGIDWMFYITGVTHYYEFGGESTTTLTLSRGLPKALYDGSGYTVSNGLTPASLADIHTGNATKRDGEYLKGIAYPGQIPLRPINMATPGVAGFLAGLPGIFSQAQKK